MNFSFSNTPRTYISSHSFRLNPLAEPPCRRLKPNHHAIVRRPTTEREAPPRHRETTDDGERSTTTLRRRRQHRSTPWLLEQAVDRGEELLLSFSQMI